MNIGLLTGEFPPMQGGVGAFTQELAKALAVQGHEVHVITSAVARPPRTAVPAQNFRELLGRMDEWREPIELGYARLHPRGRGWRWADMGMVADIALRYDLDVVNVQYQPAAYNMRSAAVNFLPWRLRGLTKCVVTFHDLRTPYLFPKAGPLRPWVVRHMARWADGVIVTNQADEASLTAAHLPTPLRQIPIGSNISAVRPADEVVAAVRQQLGVGEGGILLAYFGFLHESKGADTLIHALGLLPPHVQAVFVGGQTGSSDHENNQLFGGQLQGEIERLGLGGRVHWTGFVEDAAVSAYLCAADMLVMPYKDGASLRRGTLMAGLAHGQAVITTHPTHPLPELRHGENVWLVGADAPGAVAEAVGVLAADGGLRGRLGVGAQQVAAGFTWDKIAQRTAEFLHEVVKNTTP